MRALFTSTSGEGHVGPLLPFAEAVRRAGGAVAFAAPGAAGAAARAAGFEVFDVAQAPRALREPWFARARREPEGNVNSYAVREVFAGMDARAALPGVLAACRGWNPDLLLYESCEFAAVLAGELGGVPGVRVAIGSAVTERVILDAAAAPLATWRSELGLPPDHEPHAGALSLTLWPAPLEDPAVPELPGSRRFRVPLPAPRPLPVGWTADDRPLVYLTFGTVAPGSELFPGLYRGAAQAVATLPVRVVVAVGRDADPAALEPLPANVHAHGWIDQPSVLARAALVVCHGGSGTIGQALAAGVPLALLPLFADQPHNAQRIAALGAGVVVGQAPAAAEALAGAAAEVLAHARYRAAASAVAEAIARHPPADEAAELLRSWLSRSRR